MWNACAMIRRRDTPRVPHRIRKDFQNAQAPQDVLENGIAGAPLGRIRLLANQQIVVQEFAEQAMQRRGENGDVKAGNRFAGTKFVKCDNGGRKLRQTCNAGEVLRDFRLVKRSQPRNCVTYRLTECVKTVFARSDRGMRQRLLSREQKVETANV
jgi:hypothetical protein